MPDEAKELVNKTLYSGYLAEGKMAEKFRSKFQILLEMKIVFLQTHVLLQLQQQ